jgi:hypothetical protein
MHVRYSLMPCSLQFLSGGLEGSPRQVFDLLGPNNILVGFLQGRRCDMFDSNLQSSRSSVPVVVLCGPM